MSQDTTDTTTAAAPKAEGGNNPGNNNNAGKGGNGPRTPRRRRNDGRGGGNNRGGNRGNRGNQGNQGGNDNRGNRGNETGDFPEIDYDADPGELSGDALNLTELKSKSAAELLEVALALDLENTSRARKQDVIFSILKAHARKGEQICGDGVLEILSDGFGFLRAPGVSYVAGSDDIYVSPSQIRRFSLRTGDTISGRIRPPKEGERYFALLKVDAINYEPPEVSRHKVPFENLTPLFAQDRLRMEIGNGSTEDLTARVIDIVSPLSLIHI